MGILPPIYLFNSIYCGNIATNISFQYHPPWEYCQQYLFSIPSTVGILSPITLFNSIHHGNIITNIFFPSTVGILLPIFLFNRSLEYCHQSYILKAKSLRSLLFSHKFRVLRLWFCEKFKWFAESGLPGLSLLGYMPPISLFNSIYRGNIVTNLSLKVNNIAQVYHFNTIDRGNIAINISFQFISVWEYCPCYFLNMLIEATISLLFGYLATISLSWEVILVLTFFSFCLITHFIWCIAWSEK